MTLPESPPESMLQVMAAARDPVIPKVYGAQFNLVVGVHDLSIAFSALGVPTGIVTMSYPCAKTLLNSLREAFETYEKAAGFVVEDALSLEQRLKGTLQSKQG